MSNYYKNPALPTLKKAYYEKHAKGHEIIYRGFFNVFFTWMTKKLKCSY